MEKRIIIAGSRNFNDYELVKKTVEKLIESDTIIISGTANGADKLGERFAEEFNLKLVKMPANWKTYGKSAGIIRNQKMSNFAKEKEGILVAFWDGKSNGTKEMIKIAKKDNLEVHVILFS